MLDVIKFSSAIYIIFVSTQQQKRWLHLFYVVFEWRAALVTCMVFALGVELAQDGAESNFGILLACDYLWR